MLHSIVVSSFTKSITRFLRIFSYFGYDLGIFFPRLVHRSNNSLPMRDANTNIEPTHSSSSSLSSSTQTSSEESFANSSDITFEDSSEEDSVVCSPECRKDDDVEITDIEEIHTRAISQKSRTYIDPATGFTVFTEYSHLKRGQCCGSVCRHCPYGWENVKHQNENGEIIRKQPKVRSGDKVNVKHLLDKIEAGDTTVLQPAAEVVVTCCDKSIGNNPEKKRTSKKKRGKGGRSGGALTSKNVPYTRSGDAGTSMLITGERRSKDDLAFEAMGTVDELCSVVGVAHAELAIGTNEKDFDYGNLSEWLLDVMSRLFDIGSHIAKPTKHDVDDGNRFSSDGIGGGFDSDHIDVLEECIDIMTEALPELNSFILPTGGRATTQLHVARCVCRRAERRILPLVKIRVSDPNAMSYLNRLSDFFFTASRFVNYCEGCDELMYKRHIRGSKQRDRVTVKLRDE